MRAAAPSPRSRRPSGTLTDARDGKLYRIVQIGAQLRMAQNLDYGARVDASAGQADDGTTEKYCAGDCDAACEALGGVYQWAEALALPSACNTESCDPVALPQRGICPQGYHVPTVEEFAELVSSVEATAGENNEPTRRCCASAWTLGASDTLGCVARRGAPLVVRRFGSRQVGFASGLRVQRTFLARQLSLSRSLRADDLRARASFGNLRAVDHGSGRSLRGVLRAW